MSKGAFKSQYFFFVKKGACARPFERQELGSSTKEARSASKLGSTLNQDHNSIFLWYSILLFLEFIVLHVKADDIPQNVNSFRMPKCVHSQLHLGLQQGDPANRSVYHLVNTYPNLCMLQSQLIQLQYTCQAIQHPNALQSLSNYIIKPKMLELIN